MAKGDGITWRCLSLPEFCRIWTGGTGPLSPLSAVAVQDVEIVSHKSLPERAPEVSEFLETIRHPVR